MKEFRMDNTEGFSQEQLDVMNEAYCAQVSSDMSEDEKQSVSEKILNEYC